MKKSTPIISAAIVICIAVVICALFYFSKQTVPTVIERQTIPKFVQPWMEDHSLSTSTVDWKTYTNNEAGFEFKYPPSKKVEFLKDRNTWVLNEADPGYYDADSGYYINVTVSDKARYVAPSVSHSSYIYTYASSTNTFDAEDIREINPVIAGKCPPLVTVNSIPAYFIFKSGHYTAGGNEDSNYLIITNKDYVIDIDFGDEGSGTNEILSTFHLIGDTKAIKAACNK